MWYPEIVIFRNNFLYIDEYHLHFDNSHPSIAKLIPLYRTFSFPAWVIRYIKFLLNSAKVPKICNSSFPFGDVVSMLESCKDINSMPFFSRIWIVFKKSIKDLAILSIFVMTTMSTPSISNIILWKAGLFVEPPDLAWSSYIFNS